MQKNHINSEPGEAENSTMQIARIAVERKKDFAILHLPAEAAQMLGRDVFVSHGTPLIDRCTLKIDRADEWFANMKRLRASAEGIPSGEFLMCILFFDSVPCGITNNLLPIPLRLLKKTRIRKEAELGWNESGAILMAPD